jgi:hypothetical protein
MLSHVYLLTKVRRRPPSRVLGWAQKDVSSSHVATHNGLDPGGCHRKIRAVNFSKNFLCFGSSPCTATAGRKALTGSTLDRSRKISNAFIKQVSRASFCASSVNRVVAPRSESIAWHALHLPRSRSTTHERWESFNNSHE